MTETPPKDDGVLRCEKQGRCWRDPPVTKEIAATLDRHLREQRALYPALHTLELKISGCSSFCGLGEATLLVVGQDDLEPPRYRFSVRTQAGESQWHQIWLGEALRPEQVPAALSALLDLFLQVSLVDETFQQAVNRLGSKIFAEEIEDLFAGRRSAR